MLFKTLYRSATNSDKLEKSFDWGVSAGINIDPQTGNITPDLSGQGIKKPSDFRVVMYGIAKRNGVWHGSKINTFN